MSVRQRVTDGVPATDSKSVLKLNPSNNTFKVKSYFHPEQCFQFKRHPTESSEPYEARGVLI